MPTADRSAPVEREALLALHRELVAVRSVSHDEEALASHVASRLAAPGVEVVRLERNVIARTGRGGGPRLLLNSHLDTVPPTSSWTMDPWTPLRRDGRVYGLGSNDAKASVAAMMDAFLAAARTGLDGELVLALVADEETGGRGTEIVLPELARRGLAPDAAVVGEPTGLDVATSQKGMLVLELRAVGDACHSANATALGARNPIDALARDLVALRGVDLGPEHEHLGRTTMQPTVLRGGEAKNRVPASASAVLDLRTVPGLGHDALIERLRAAVEGEIHVASQRLEPYACAADATIVRAARRANAAARVYGSPTMSDLVFIHGVPGIKCGPGQSARSHTADEYVLEDEVVEGAGFYRRLIAAWFEEARAATRAGGAGGGS